MKRKLIGGLLLVPAIALFVVAARTFNGMAWIQYGLTLIIGISISMCTVAGIEYLKNKDHE